MRTDRVWDLLVVGGGTAGIVASTTAASLGARVLLVERARTGGDCLWTGCVPSKALLAAGSAAAHARAAEELGVTARDVAVDFGRVMEHVHGAVATIAPVDSPDALRAAGVRVVAGEARFTAPRTVEVDGRTLRFHQALLATGSAPALPSVPGLAGADPWTSDTVWELRELPRRLTVVGGGTTGCELGQAFARLGSQVTVVEAGPRILPAEDPDAAAVVRAALERDGVAVLTGSRLVEVSGATRAGGTVVVEHDGVRRDVPYDALLVAVGRTPRTGDLGLAAAGVRLTDAGSVVVDRTLRTSNPRVWAAGDLTGHPQYTHVAGVHGALAASNAVLGLRRTVDTDAVPRVTFTDPEVAAVGAASSSTTGPAPRTVTRAHTHVDRAVTERSTTGFSRLVLGRRRRVVGATVVGPRAGEALAELTLAVRQGLTTADLLGAIHAYPTYADGQWNAAIADVLAELARPAVRALTRGVAAGRRFSSRWRG